MKHQTSILLAGAAVAAIVLLVVLRDVPSNVLHTKGEVEQRVEVAYPPPYPSYPEPPPMPVPTMAKTSGEFDLCGYGPVNPEQLPPSFEGEADAAILRVATELERAKDDRTRALGLATRAWVVAHAAERAVVAEDPKTCRETAACDERGVQAFLQAAQPSIDALVRLATTTRDPHAYVTAMRMCRTLLPDAPPPICNGLSVEQWVQVDPDNAFAWLHVAHKAHHRKDRRAFDEALLRASQANVFDRRDTQFGEVLRRAEFETEPARALAVTKLASAYKREDPADYYSHFTILLRHCEKRDEPGRKEFCGEFAQRLTERSAQPVGLLLGAAIAQSAGLPKEQTAAVVAEGKGLDALRRIAETGIPNLTCRASAQTEEWLRGVTQLGELAYLRTVSADKHPR